MLFLGELQGNADSWRAPQLPEPTWDTLKNQESAHGKGCPEFCGLGTEFSREVSWILRSSLCSPLNSRWFLQGRKGSVCFSRGMLLKKCIYIYSKKWFIYISLWKLTFTTVSFLFRFFFYYKINIFWSHPQPNLEFCCPFGIPSPIERSFNLFFSMQVPPGSGDSQKINNFSKAFPSSGSSLSLKKGN